MCRREYFSSAVKLVISSLKMLPITKENFSDTILFTVINKYDKGTVVQISALLGLLYPIVSPRVLGNRTF